MPLQIGVDAGDDFPFITEVVGDLGNGGDAGDAVGGNIADSGVLIKAVDADFASDLACGFVFGNLAD
jgi:hypothetical protein